jgi:hypothetical protein
MKKNWNIFKKLVNLRKSTINIKYLSEIDKIWRIPYQRRKGKKKWYIECFKLFKN